MKKNTAIVLSILFLFSINAMSAPKVGRSAAARYFQSERKSDRYTASALGSEESGSSSESASVTRVDHFMAFGVGTFSEGIAYNWGPTGKEEKVGQWGADITYRLSEQEYLFDQALKISYAQFRPALQDATKLSFMYSATFPEAGSRFPLYFGAAAGLGIYLKQLKNESRISFDYQLYLGLRIFNVFESVGFYVEGGLRNHLHLMSDGQFNGTFLSLGSVFTF